MSGKSLVVQKDGILYTITNTDHNLEDSSLRLRFIFRDSFRSKDDFQERWRLSNCYLQYKKRGVRYAPEIQSKLQD
jgi:hypothetical protein